MVRRLATVPPIQQPVALPGSVPACHELIQQLLQSLEVLGERGPPELTQLLQAPIQRWPEHIYLRHTCA